MKLPLLALAACALFAVPAAAQDEVVRAQLDAAAELMANEGFALQGSYRAGALRNGAEETVPVELQAGVSYAIMGVCDADCSDMDLILNDPSGMPIEQDIAADDVPIVAVEVTRSGTYQLRVTMPACSVEPCGYGLALFAQN